MKLLPAGHPRPPSIWRVVQVKCHAIYLVVGFAASGGEVLPGAYSIIVKDYSLADCGRTEMQVDE
jgi:hypothetical protein